MYLNQVDQGLLLLMNVLAYFCTDQFIRIDPLLSLLKRSPLKIIVSRKLVSFSDISAVNLIVSLFNEQVDCSQSPYFSVGFSRLVRFDGSAVILVCKGERDPKLPRGAGVGVSIVSATLNRYPPLGS